MFGCHRRKRGTGGLGMTICMSGAGGQIFERRPRLCSLAKIQNSQSTFRPSRARTTCPAARQIFAETSRPSAKSGCSTRGYEARSKCTDLLQLIASNLFRVSQVKTSVRDHGMIPRLAANGLEPPDLLVMIGANLNQDRLAILREDE